MAKNFKELRGKMSPESRARAEARAEQMIKDMALDELRAARNLTQEHLAKVWNVSQGFISQFEHRADMYVSTLGDFIKAMGGRLEIHAVFPDGDVRLTTFDALANPKTEEIAAAPKKAEKSDTKADTNHAKPRRARRVA